ncbi:MAG TPA: hypothetical protein VMW51_11365 [Terriglobia bacterium]|nr:hypothetical protein [Terriglobia bacterium]
MKIEGRPDLGIDLMIRLTESEARALDALAGYNFETFLETFYQKIGRAYLEPHEDGLRSLFIAIRDKSGIRAVLSRMDACRSVWNGTKVAIDAAGEGE